MTTATAEAPTTETIEQAREVAKSNPELALEAVIAETEKLKIAHEREQRDAKTLSEVKFGPGGLECDNLAALWRVGQMLARSDMVPEQYRGKPENCLIALQMAQRCRVDVFMFMQNTYIVHGRPGIEAKLAIAMLNMSGKIDGRMKFDVTGRGPSMECTASVFDRESREVISMTVDWKMVQAEKWDSKAGSKWNTMPEIMFCYRSAMFLIRTHYPEVLLGMQTVDELEDMLGNPAVTERAADQNDGSGSAQDRIAEQLGVGDPPESKQESKPPENQPADTPVTEPATNSAENQDTASAGAPQGNGGVADSNSGQSDETPTPAADQPADGQKEPPAETIGWATPRAKELAGLIDQQEPGAPALLSLRQDVINAREKDGDNGVSDADAETLIGMLDLKKKGSKKK